MPTMHWDFAIILIILGVPIPLLGRRRIRQLIRQASTSKLERLILYTSTIAFQAILVSAILWRTSVYQITPRDLGLSVQHVRLTLGVGAALCGLFLLNQLLAIRRMEQHSERQTGILVHLVEKVFPQDFGERMAFCALVITVAACEELIYRGFVQFVFQQVTGAVLLGVLFSALFFAFAHFYQGKHGVASTFVVGVIFASVRSWTGSLFPSIGAHFIADLSVGILGPIRLRRAGPFDGTPETGP